MHFSELKIGESFQSNEGVAFDFYRFRKIRENEAILIDQEVVRAGQRFLFQPDHPVKLGV